MKKTLLAALITLISACSTNPRPPVNITIEEWIAFVSKKEFLLSPEINALNPGMSGTPDPIFGYLGIKNMLSPLDNRCISDGGELYVAHNSNISNLSQPLPLQIQCKSSTKIFWVIFPKYSGYTAKERGQTWIHVTATPQFFTAEAFAQKEIEESKQRKEEQAIKAIKKYKKDEQEISENLEQWNKVAIFRKNIKPTDKFQWKPPGSAYLVYGMVINVTGDMAFVQFDNFQQGGQSTRYLPKNELEPIGAKYSNSWGRPR